MLGSPVVADDAMASCPGATRVTEDDVLNDRIKPYAIEPTDAALLKARDVFLKSDVNKLVDVASAEDDLKTPSFGTNAGTRITRAIGVCNTRKQLEIMALANRLIIERFGRLPAGNMSETRLFLSEAMSDAFTMIVFHDRFTSAQIKAYSGPYGLLYPSPR